MKRETYYRLPSGEYTTNENDLVAWVHVGDKLAKILNCRILGYDPGVQIAQENSVVTLPMWVVNRILELGE